MGELMNCKTVKLPDGLEVVEEMMFFYSNVEEAFFPASVKEIKSCAFAHSKL